MFTRCRRATAASASVDALGNFGDTNSLAISLADISVDVPAVTAVSTVSELFRPVSPVDLTPDTPTITRILLSTLDGVQCGVPTLTTPTLTPTTLRNIQQTFLQASQVQPPESHTNQAGFVPPFVHPQPGSTFISIDSRSLGGGIATLVEPSSFAEGGEPASTFTRDGLCISSGPPPLLPIAGILPTTTSLSCSNNSWSQIPCPAVSPPTGPPSSPMPSVSLSAYSSDSDTIHSSDAPPSRRMGGRRPNNSEKLSEEECHKRSIRRERNKMAAARCRKRRLDQTTTLQDETDRLEEKKSSLQNEITVLQQQREELEFLLATHKAVCTRSARTKSTVIVTTSSRDYGSSVPITMSVASSYSTDMDRKYQKPIGYQEISVKEENISDTEEQYNNSLFGTIIPNSTSITPITAVSNASSIFVPSTTTSFRDRIHLAKPNRPTSLAVAPLTELGVSIETPSAGLRGLNFESMMDGGTGLTPVTPLTGALTLSTGLTPLTTPIVAHPSASVVQCSYQQRTSSSELSSPDSMSSKQLVSL